MLDRILTRQDYLLPAFMIIYGAASLTHFIHNAVYLQFYPNMPTWLTPAGVLASWLAVAGLGAAGYWLFRRRWKVAGLSMIALYAVLGFGGFDHFVVAPVSAHSFAMKATIVGEAAAASLLLGLICFRVMHERPGERCIEESR